MKIIILGCGRVGATLATLMSKDHHDVTVIDLNGDAFARLGLGFNGRTHVGDGTDEDVLRRAGLENADAFAAVTNGDNRNIMASQIAREIFKVKKVVCRIYDPIREETYREMGLETFCPTKMGAQMLFDLVGESK